MIGGIKRGFVSVVLVALTVCAQAEEAGPATQPAALGDRLLAGPAVEAAATTEVSRLGPQRTSDQRAHAVPMQRWVRIVRGFDLAAEQESSIQGIIEEWNEARETWRVEHGEEVKRLREEARAARQSGRVDRTLLAKLQAMEKSAPNVEDYQQRIWDELTDDQQARLREMLKNSGGPGAESRGGRKGRGSAGAGGSEMAEEEGMMPATTAPGA